MKLFNHRISPKISFRKGVRKIRLTENAESVPLGVFLWMPVFRGILARPANSPDVSGSLFNSGVRKKLPQLQPRAGDLAQNSLWLWLTGISELTT